MIWELALIIGAVAIIFGLVWISDEVNAWHDEDK